MMPHIVALIFILHSLFLGAKLAQAAEDISPPQSSSAQTQTAVHQQPPASKSFTWDFVAATEGVKSSNTHTVNGLYTSLKSSLLYALSEHNEFRLYGSFVKESYADYDGRSYLELGEFMYRRKGILNSQDHWINLDFELKYAHVLDSGIRRLWGFNGETIPQIIIKKRLPGAFNLEAKFRHHFYHQNNSKPSTLSGEDRIYFSAGKMFAGNFIVNTEFRYRHKSYNAPHYSHERGGFEGKVYEDIVFHPALMYFVSRSALIEGYFETKLKSNFDDRPLLTLAKDELIAGAALYLTIL